MQPVGHILDVHPIPPELPQEECELCRRTTAIVILEMNPIHSKDMQLCKECAHRIYTINSLLKYIETEN